MSRLVKGPPPVWSSFFPDDEGGVALVDELRLCHIHRFTVVKIGEQIAQIWSAAGSKPCWGLFLRAATTVQLVRSATSITGYKAP
jgi:hypothetical protein